MNTVYWLHVHLLCKHLVNIILFKCFPFVIKSIPVYMYNTQAQLLYNTTGQKNFRLRSVALTFDGWVTGVNPAA